MCEKEVGLAHRGQLDDVEGSMLIESSDCELFISVGSLSQPLDNPKKLRSCRVNHEISIHGRSRFAINR